MSDDIKALREALAAGPTPGPWEYEPPASGGRVLAQDPRWTIVHEPPCSPFNDEAIADAMLIAAASPDRIARLLDEVERLRAEQQSWRQKEQRAVREAIEAVAERDALRTALLSGNPAQALEMLLKAQPLDAARKAAT